MKVIDGDIFDLPVEALVNPVNCVGIMGKGLAAQFRKKFLANYKAYRKACDKGDMLPGSCFVTEYKGRREGLRYIVNFPTKRHWRDGSLLADITEGLWDLRRIISAYRIESIAIPALGCGLGGLDWEGQVLPEILKILGNQDEVAVFVIQP